MSICNTIKRPSKPLTRLHRPEPLPLRQRSPQLLMIPNQSSRITHLLKRLPRYIPSHVGGLTGREKRRVANIVDALLPLSTRLRRWVDELQSLSVDRVDGVPDPAPLDFDAGGAVAEECWAVGTIEVEHVGVAGDGCAEIGELEAMCLRKEVLCYLYGSMRLTAADFQSS